MIMKSKTIIRLSGQIDARCEDRRFYRHGSAALVGPLNAERFDSDDQAQGVIDSMVKSGNWKACQYCPFTLHL